MADFDDGDGWAEVQVKKKVKAQAKAVLIKQEDELFAQENKSIPKKFNIFLLKFLMKPFHNIRKTPGNERTIQR
jgi:hypothetical protein